MILTKAEIKALDRGKRVDVFVEEHTRSVLYRAPQVMKNKRIYDFHMSFINQLRRHGMSRDDKRHIQNLVRLLLQEIDNG